MKRILMIVENKLSLESMLTKALRFTPAEIHLHCFESSGADEAAAGIQATVDGLVKDQCQVHLTVESAVAKKKTARISSGLNNRAVATGAVYLIGF